ncbi:adipocyte plasma membrane-associated protein [Plakobranchus ocellatus]|uniref:Adipocyte plasma membrane-associated protein n=1 Tax=Plakobranchus ocellatus TaxID=259542 RepID=A0AAV4DVJ7_9GAST|nr:adipocyte plasma membrane-associated protein [Plakobranchus ocellatus]
MMLFTSFSICFLVFSPLRAADILPVLYELPPSPALTGALEQNKALTKAERYKLNQVVGAASFAFHRGTELPPTNLSSQSYFVGVIDSDDIESISDHIYTGLANGKIVDVSDCGVKVVASLGPPYCRSEQQCGRPMALRMDGQGRLIVADAHRGIFRINLETDEFKVRQPNSTPFDTMCCSTGQKEMLYSSSTAVGGRPCKFINDVVVAGDGTILFTDSSARWPRQEQLSILLEGQSTGRLLAYSDKSNQAIVVLKNLSFPNGLQLGPNDEFLLITETGRAKISKLSLLRDNSWLSLSDFASNLPGLPDNIRASGRGTYWVAFAHARHENMTSLVDDYDDQPQMRRIIAKMYSKDQIKSMTARYGIVAELDETGAIIRTLHDPTGLKVDSVSEAIEKDGYLYLGSWDKPYISRVATTKQFNVERFLSKLKSTCRATTINIDRLRVILRRLIAIAELRRTLLAAKRRQEEEQARRATTQAPPTDSTSSTVDSTVTASVTETSTTALDQTGSTPTAATSAPSTDTTARASDSSTSTATLSVSDMTSSAPTSAATPVATIPGATTTLDEETGGIVDPSIEEATTADETTTAATSAATVVTTASGTTSSTQAGTEATSASTPAETSPEVTTSSATTDSTAAASTDSQTTAATSADTTASTIVSTISTSATT